MLYMSPCRLRKLQQDIIRLDEVASRIKELKLSADQLVAEAELQLEKETANAADLTRCLDVLSKRKFKNAQVQPYVIVNSAIDNRQLD